MYKAFAMCLKPVMKVPTDKKKKKKAAYIVNKYGL
jgi:hypothetical protein